MNNIDALIQHYGSQELLAKALGVTQGAISQWKTGKTTISPTNALKIEKITDGKFKAVDLCPQLIEIEKLKAPSGN
ncbi:MULTISPECIES: transcriptional regulator [unclassified Moraxella]|uniref:transcriptional regulator n=1 Tax=unclassified Moraxella TaxID=2685852 RepID=UPI00359EF8F7